MRLQKYLAMCGVASRRGAEDLIARGRVRVDGKTVDTMGFQVEEGASVEVDGKPVRPASRKRYIMLYKPQGVITSASDPEGRATVLDIVKAEERIFPVGRLDYDTEGLLLLTNDGEMAQRLTHPSHGVDKLYVATVRGEVSRDAVAALERGVELDDGHVTAPAQVKVISRGATSQLSIVVHEGHNRLIRRMCEAVGHPVLSLKREGFGPLRLGHLKTGQWRNLSPAELAALLGDEE